ncbi:hypothetical protein CP980_05205 [Streptomyces vinaceus]|uniref:Uncharacterized protein n=1 Tax=Streptomyces vinaceus TaxID=1960 RepID=A0A5J6J236_STRVI|nr:hypothetical protein CP980_05205 [Streptomyces vinaceus]
MPAPPKPVPPPPLQVKAPDPVVTPPPPPPKKPVARPAYHTAAVKRPEHHISPVTFTLMTAAPAVLAIVALRPR